MIRSLSATVKAVLLVAVIGAGGLGLWPASVEAHGVVDQAWDDVAVFSGLQIQSLSPIGQEFTPSSDTVGAVDVLLGKINEFGDATITLRIRDATISGTVLSSASQTVPGNLINDEPACSDPQPCRFIHFDLASAVTVVPGQKYVIELESSNPTHSFLAGPQFGDEYLGGEPILNGTVKTSDRADFFFRTYSAEPQAVGGIALDRDADLRPLETAESSSGSFGVYAWAIAAFAGAFAVGTTAWYARKRLG